MHPLREASLRIAAFEKRMGKMGSDQMRMITGMLYSNALSAATKKFVLACPSKTVIDEVTKEEKLVAARDDFKEMRAAEEELVNIEIRTKPQKMDVSSMEATTAIEYSYFEWAEYWMDCEHQEAEYPGAGIDTASNAGSSDALNKRQRQRQRRRTRKGQRERQGHGWKRRVRQGSWQRYMG